MCRILVVTLLAVLLAACEDQKRQVKDTVFAPQMKALEKARAVEGKVQQDAEKTRAAVESIDQKNESQTER